MPVQPPSVVVSVSPSSRVPLTTGTVTLAGASCSIVSVAGEVAEGEEPASLTAVTTTRIVLPTSAGPSVYVLPVSPAMSTQLSPEASQRCHWYS